MFPGTMFSLYLVLILSASVCSESVSPPPGVSVSLHTKTAGCDLGPPGGRVRVPVRSRDPLASAARCYYPVWGPRRGGWQRIFRP